ARSKLIENPRTGRAVRPGAGWSTPPRWPPWRPRPCLDRSTMPTERSSDRSSVVEQLRVALLHQRLLDGGLVHLVVVFLACLGLDAQAGEQLHVLVGLRVAGGQQLLAIENGVGPGQEGQRLHLFVHLFAA